MPKPILRLPIGPIVPHLPTSNIFRILGTNNVVLGRARGEGLTTHQARRWAAILGLDAETLWPELADPLLSFWARVDKRGPGECWPWTGYTEGGYGRLHVEGCGMIGAHQFSAEIAAGHKKPDGLDTCHSCDNPLCVNPAHLRFDTRQANVDDAVTRGRHAHGETNGRSILTERQVREILGRSADGERGIDLAAEYGVGPRTIYAIRSGRRWAHITKGETK